MALESKNHLILAHEPAWPRFVDEVCRFLDEEPPPPSTAAPPRSQIATG